MQLQQFRHVGLQRLVVGIPRLVVGLPRLVVGLPRLVVGPPRLVVVGLPRLVVGLPRLVVGLPRLVVGLSRLVVGLRQLTLYELEQTQPQLTLSHGLVLADVAPPVLNRLRQRFDENPVVAMPYEFCSHLDHPLGKNTAGLFTLNW